MSIRQTIARNTFFNAGGRVWEALVGLVLIAYIVQRLGTEGYGLWSVVAAFTGYAALFDVGFGSGYTKYVAEYAAKNEHNKISSVVSAGLIFYLIFGAIFVGVLWPLTGYLMDLMARAFENSAGSWSDAARRDDVRFLVQWSLVLFALGNCVAPFTSIQAGLQRMGITNAVGVLSSFVKIIATVFYLENGYGVRGLLYAQAWVLGTFMVCSVIFAFRLCPGLRVGPGQVSRDMLNRLFQFGWRTQVSRLSNLVMFQTDILVIAFLLNDLRLAGLYQIGVELANKLRQIPAILWSALIPAASEMEARSDKDRLRELYLRSTKYVALLVMPMVAFTGGAAGMLIPVWQGFDTHWGTSVVVLQWMVFGYIANILPGPGVTVVLGMGRPEVQMRAGLISLTANIALTLLLVKIIGFWGIPVATVISMYLSWGWFVHAMRSVVDVGAVTLWRESIRGATVASIPVVLFAFGGSMLSTSITSRVEGFFGLTVMLAFCTAMYLAAIKRPSNFDAKDLDFMDHTLKLKHVPGYKSWSVGLRDV